MVENENKTGRRRARREPKEKTAEAGITPPSSDTPEAGARRTSNPNWKGNPQLERFLVDLGAVALDKKNARRHSPASVKGIATALEQFGQQTPIVIDKAGVVRKGNGTVQAALKLEWTAIAAVVTDLDDDGKVRMYALADNRTSEQSDWNVENLSRELQDLSKVFDAEVLTKWWDQYELEPLLGARWTPAEQKAMTESDEMKMGKPVHLTKEQRLTVDRAVANFKAQEAAPNLSDGYIIERICADWLSGN